MDTADVAICVEARPGEFIPIITTRVTKPRVQELFLAVARLNDVVGCLRVIIGDNLVRSIRMTSDGAEIRGIPITEA